MREEEKMKKMREGDLPEAKLYSGRIKRLVLALIRHGYTLEEALEFVSSAKGIPDKNKGALADWYTENLPRLEEREDYKAIMEECACCLGGKREEAAKAIFKEEATLQERVRRLIETPLIVGYKGEIIDEKSFYINFYPEMEFYRCSCLRLEKGKQKSPMPRGYCYCCGGHLKHHIERALGEKVEVELIISSLVSMGEQGCKFKVTITEGQLPA